MKDKADGNTSMNSILRSFNPYVAYVEGSHGIRNKTPPLTPVERNFPNAISFPFPQINEINTTHGSKCGLVDVSIFLAKMQIYSQLKDSKLSKISLISLT